MEWQSAGGSLQSAVVYRRLLEEGIEVPGYQMSAILNSFKVGGLITAPHRNQREEEVREHGDLLVMSVHSDLCQLPGTNRLTSETRSHNRRFLEEEVVTAPE